MPSCCCRSAARRRPSRCCRSWRTSPAAAASRASGSTTVAEHYLHFGGVSPINGINRALIDAAARPRSTCRSTSATATGSRTSRTRLRPCATTGFAARRCSPRRRGAGTPAARSTSRTSPAAAPRPVTGAPELVKLRQYFDHPLLIEMFADAIAEAAADAARRAAREARLVFTAHSIPLAARRAVAPTFTRARSPTPRAGRRRGGLRRLRPGVAVTVGPAAGALAGTRCRPTTSRRWRERGTEAVIVCPIGFVADHIEVVWDLDNELTAQAQELGIAFARAATPNADPRFAELVDRPYRRAARRPRAVESAWARTRSSAATGFSIDGALCTPGLREGLAPPGRVQDRADRGQPGRAHHRGQRTQRLVGDLRLRRDSAAPIGIKPELTVTIASMCAAFSSTRSARDGAWSGARCLPDDSITCSTSLRGSATSTPPASARMAPSASAADRTAERSANSASPRSRCSAIGAAGSEYTVQLRPDSSASSDVVVGRRSRRTRSRAPGRSAVPTVRRRRRCASPAVDRVALRTGCPRAARGHRRAPGSATRDRGRAGARTRPRCAASAAATWSPESFRSGQGRPVLPAATES